MCLEQRLIAISMAGVVPHMSGGHFSDIQTPIISKILLNKQIGLNNSIKFQEYCVGMTLE